MTAAALEAAVDLMGEGRALRRCPRAAPAAEDMLRGLEHRTGRASGREILHSHPSAALRQHADEDGYELLAVVTRGAGITKAILDSAASELARDSEVPVLLVGGPAKGDARH